MYFDSVVDTNYDVLFNGTPEETREWLTASTETEAKLVCTGRTLEVLSVEEYLKPAK